MCCATNDNEILITNMGIKGCSNSIEPNARVLTSSWKIKKIKIINFGNGGSEILEFCSMLQIKQKQVWDSAGNKTLWVDELKEFDMVFRLQKE